MKAPSSDTPRTGAVAVIGGGIGGMQSSLDLAEAGFKVYLIDNSPAIGGTMARLDKTFPTNDCAMCVMSPKLVDCARHLNIDIITNADIEGFSGKPGNFRLKIRKKARFVDLEKCTGCGDCTDPCPVEFPSEFDQGLTARKVIYRLYPQAVPAAFIVDKKKEKSPCRIACPAGVNAHGYVSLINQGKFKQALDLIRERDPFPSICGRVCYHPCEQECLRKEVDEPIAIRELKRFVADYELKDNQGPRVKKIEPQNGAKAVIVGSGPAGLTCAYDLLRLGYKVVVYEKLPQAGGMLLAGIPGYRLPQKIREVEIQRLVDMGIEIKTNTPVGKEPALSRLQKEYRAIFIAVGAHLSRRLGIPGEDMEGVIHGIDFLREFNLSGKASIGKKVAIVGGGNVAIDSARTAFRLGAEEVTIIYRRSRAEMPANPWEIKEAEEEGIKFHYLVSPIKIIGKNKRATGMECIRMELGEPDGSGRRRPVPIKDSEFEIEADLIIPAIGQLSDLSFTGDKINKTDWGTIQVDPLTLATSSPGIFAGGDAVSGPATVVEAIAAGHEAAVSIDRYIRGEDLKKDRGAKLEKVTEVREGVGKAERILVPKLPVVDRIKDFSEVELEFTEEMALTEARRCLNCALCAECMECVKACEAEAINHEMKDEIIELEVGSVILAAGYDRLDAALKGEYGYGRYPNVITSLQFERLLSSSGPTAGEILRPSDGKLPHRIAFIQCVGSRDIQSGNEYCSSVCCMYSTKEAIIAKEHHKEIEATIFFIDIRAFGKDFDKYYENAREQYGVRYVRSQVSKVYQLQQTKNLTLRYVLEDGKIKEEEFDLIVLAVGMVPTAGSNRLKEYFGIEPDEYGFARTKDFSLTETTRPGVFAAGTFVEPEDIPETVVGASSAGAYASELLGDSRWTLTRKKEYPPERDVSEEELRVGVIVCRCGRNIASVVDVPDLTEFAKGLPDVVYADEFIYSCSQDSLVKIKEKIKEHRLNRVVVASCTPRTHDPLFRDTIREAGLNRCLFDMASIREHCSWVHIEKPKEATRKAKTLVAMAVSKVRLLYPVKRRYFDVTKKALVIGGGVSGMSAALSIARQGFSVYLLERERELGGHLSEIYFTLDGARPQELLKKIIEEVKNNPLINIYCQAQVKELSGYVGNFKTIITTKEGEIELGHGAVIVATGAEEYQPTEYLYEKDSRVLLQSEFEERLYKKDPAVLGANSLVMLQCVESREEKRLYCSRTCCSTAIKNAIRFKELNPEANLFILYRDIRAYGFMERYYKEAREKGIIFIRYEKEAKPEVELKNEKLIVKLTDPVMGKPVTLKPDILVLSTGMKPRENDELSKRLKVPLNEDRFFLEAHAKIRPLDFTTEGIFLCGTAHSPRHIPEAITQAKAAAMRAVTILAKDQLEGKSEIVWVREELCRGCGVCITVCPYDAREIDEEAKTAKVLEAVCQGCGACAVACPSGATRHLMFEKRQVMAMVEEAIST